MTARLITVLLATVLCGSGCASTNWWDEPPQEPGKVYAVGTVLRGKNIGATRTFAEADARGKLASYVGTQVQQLTEVYNGEGGEAGLPDKAPSFFNNESIIRTLTNTKLMGARTLKYGKDEKYYYVLMVLDLESFTKLWKQTVEAEAARQNYLASQALKQAYSQRLDRTLDKYTDRPAVQQGVAIDRNNTASDGTTIRR